ncbi:hypothetical protein D1839_01505 [Roseburia sp. 1XD42-34]|nr:hypothetical protein [Roseburia sp. 1XD42-34]RKI81928.1 hypothetical protein D7V87_01505 [Clostridium sp. 1xD42-85]
MMTKEKQFQWIHMLVRNFVTAQMLTRNKISKAFTLIVSNSAFLFQNRTPSFGYILFQITNVWADFRIHPLLVLSFIAEQASRYSI